MEWYEKEITENMLYEYTCIKEQYFVQEIDI